MPIHNHFDGSEHCVECGGPCRLTGDSLALTRMVRCRLEREVYASKEPRLSYGERAALRAAGYDPDVLIDAARKARA